MATSFQRNKRVSSRPLVSLCCWCFYFIAGNAFIGIDGKQQEFIEKPQYMEVNPGDTAVLRCLIRDIGGECSWQRDRKPMRIFTGKHEWNGQPDQGDCSLRVLNSSLNIDDGEWECQVTATSFDQLDALGSEVARLVVRVAPQEPTIEFNISRLHRGQNLTTRAEAITIVKCASHYGNPPAIIRWFLDDVDISTHARQSNSSEPDKPRTWLAVSILEYSFPSTQNGKLLRCLAFHDAYALKSKEISVIMDIQYPPVTMFQGRPDKELEESKDSLLLTCTADANPPAKVLWKKDGVEQPHLRDRVAFAPLSRAQSGSYMCVAQNFLGQTSTPTVEVDVKYPPKIRSVDPTRVSVSLTNRTKLACSAEGNPQPEYQWLHSFSGDPDAAHLVGREPVLVLDNTTYDNQGQYVCVAENVINGIERRMQSQAIIIEVYGPPQVLQSARDKPEIEADKGYDAIIHVPFCSKPYPSKVFWEWGSLLLTAGEGAGGKFVAKSITQIKGAKACFEAEFIVQKADVSDSRRYVLQVENSYGRTKHAMFLTVQEPIAMLTVISIVIACLIIMVVVILILLYTFRSEKWCFRRKNAFHDKDSESELDGKVVTGAIPPDALYSVSPTKKPTKNSDDGSEYDSMMSEHNGSRFTTTSMMNNRKPEVVYADLDLARSKNVTATTPNAKTQRSTTIVHRRESPTEYAQIKVQYRPKPDEQADI